MVQTARTRSCRMCDGIAWSPDPWPSAEIVTFASALRGGPSVMGLTILVRQGRCQRAWRFRRTVRILIDFALLVVRAPAT